MLLFCPVHHRHRCLLFSSLPSDNLLVIFDNFLLPLDSFDWRQSLLILIVVVLATVVVVVDDEQKPSEMEMLSGQLVNYWGRGCSPRTLCGGGS